MTVASDLGIDTSDIRYQTILECKTRQFLEQVKADQKKVKPFFDLCPRCGHLLDKPMAWNAISRREDVLICSKCGTDEAMMDWAGKEPLHITNWALVGAIADEAAHEFCDIYPEARANA
ncbi:MAG: hypothetical protein WDA05_05155 [Candidatus Methanomethylophilaceae archaeon]